QTAPSERMIVRPQPLIVVEVVLQIPVQKAVAPEPAEDRLQIEQLVIDRERTPLRQLQIVIHEQLILEDDLVDDVRLTTKVVVEIARRNVQVRGNMIGRHIALAPLVEQIKAGQDDLVASFHAASATPVYKLKDGD